jgi:hypothetical protein
MKFDTDEIQEKLSGYLNLYLDLTNFKTILPEIVSRFLGVTR